MADIRVKQHKRRKPSSEYLRAYPSSMPPGPGTRSWFGADRLRVRETREVRAQEGDTAPEMKTLVRSQKVEIKKAKQNFRAAKVERSQVIAQSKADIEKATAAVREAKIDLKDVKFAKKQIKQGTRGKVLKASTLSPE